MARRRLEFDVSALDRASAAFVQIAASVEVLAARLEALDRQRAEPEVDVDTTRAERKLGAFARNAQDRLRSAFAQLPELPVGDTPQETQRIRELRAELQRLGRESARVGVDLDSGEFLSQVRAVGAELARLNQETASVQVRTDTAKALADLAKIDGAVQAVDGRTATVNVRVRDGAGVGTVLRNLINESALLSRNLRQLAVPYAIFAATPGIAALGNAFTELAGTVGLLPSLFQLLGASVATVVIGFKGFGDALKADDAEELAEAMAKLAPNAQLAATAFRALAPAWDAVRRAIQDNIFDGVGQSVTRLATQYLPVLKAGLGGIATELNQSMRLWTQWAIQAETVGQTSRIFENLRATVEQLAPGFRFIAEALTDIGDVGAEMLPRLSAGFTDWAREFRNRIQELADNGQLEAWIQRGIDALQRLASIAGNVGGSLRAVFNAAEVAGLPFLQTLDDATASMERFLKSVEGQSLLIGMFESIEGFVRSLTPGFQALGRAIVDSFISAGPGLQRFGTAISQIMIALSPAIPMIGALVTAFSSIIQVLADVVTFLGPIPAVLIAVSVGFRLLATTGTLIAAPFTAAAATLTRFATSLTATGVAATAASGQLALFNTNAAGTAVAGGLLATRFAPLGAGMAAVATGAGRAATVMSGLAGFLGGPLIGAVLAGVAIISLLQGANADAAAAAAEHKAALDALRGTLDQQTGAITEATVAARAEELALKGTTERAQEFGIAAGVVTQASLNQRAALEEVASKLLTSATASVEASSQYQRLKPALDAAGISAQDLARASLAGGDAMDELGRKFVGSSDNAQVAVTQFASLQDSVFGATETARAFAAEMGVAGDGLRKIAQEVILSRAGIVDMEVSMLQARTALEEFGGALDRNTGQIIQGAEGAGQLSTALGKVADDAMTLALEAGIAAEKTGGLAAGVAAAGAEMENRRGAFIALATSLGLSQVEAERLANALGLIPAVAETEYRMIGAPQAEAEIARIIAQLSAVPDTKEIVVESLTDEAIARLQELGVKVETLPDGQVKLTLEDSEFTARVQAALDAGISLERTLEMILTLDKSQFDAELEAFKKSWENPNLASPISLRVEVEGLDEARGQVEGFRAEIEGTPIPVPLVIEPPDGGIVQASFGGGGGNQFRIQVVPDLSAVVDALATIGALARGTQAEVPLTANAQGFTFILQTLVNLARALIVQVPISANPAQFTAALSALLAMVPPAMIIPIAANIAAAMIAIAAVAAAVAALAMVARFPITADPAPALGATRTVAASLDAMRARPPFPITADPGPALSSIGAVLARAAVLAAIQGVITLNNAAALISIAAVRAAALALNALSTTARHTQTDNIPEVAARIRSLGSIATTAPHTQTDNIPQVSARIRSLNSLATRAAHTQSDNTAAVRSRILSLNGLNTRSTHTITTLRVDGPGVRVAGGGVFAGGGVVHAAKGVVLPGYAPGRDVIPAMLSPGESVLTPELTRILGRSTIMSLNKMASGRRGNVFGTLAARVTAMNGRISTGGMRPGSDGATVIKNYVLHVHNANNSEVDLREQFRRLELMGG